MVGVAVALVLLVGRGEERSQRPVEDAPAGTTAEATAEATGEATAEATAETTGREQPEPPAGTVAREPTGEVVEQGRLGPPTLGDEGAPVVMVEYSDYQ